MLFLKLLKLSQCYVLRSNLLHSVNDAWFIHFSCYNLSCLVLLSQWVYKTCGFFIPFWRKRHFLSATWLSYSQLSVTVKQTTSLIQCLPLDFDSNFDLMVRLQQFFNKSVICSGMWGRVGTRFVIIFLSNPVSWILPLNVLITIDSLLFTKVYCLAKIWLPMDVLMKSSWNQNSSWWKV